MTQTKNELRRYTDILSVIDTLRNKRITLVNPERWNDRNDRHTLELYAKRKCVESVVAYCMTAAPETAHHWQLFAGDAFGVCVVFKRDEFIDHIASQEGVRCEAVEYWTLSELEDNKPVPLDKLPFIKRAAFEAEAEVRVIADHDPKANGPTRPIHIPLGLIKRVVFSPFAIRALTDTAREVLSGFKGCGKLQFSNSALMNNQRWRRGTGE